MTDSENTTTTSAITRRAALTVTLAAVPLLAAPALAAADPDAELMALGRDYDAARAALLSTFWPLEIAEESGDQAAIDAAEAVQRAAVGALKDVERRIWAAPARTVAGLAVKARIIDDLDGSEIDEEAHALARAVLAIVERRV